MDRTQSWMEAVCVERPAGSDANLRVTEKVEGWMREMGYAVRALPFDCHVWTRGASHIDKDGVIYSLSPSPFGKPYQGKTVAVEVRTLQELKDTPLKGRIAVLTGELAKEPIMARGNPFYFPEEHRELLAALEGSGAVAAIGVMGSNILSGETPFPMFEDGEMQLPTATMMPEAWAEVGEGEVELVIESKTVPAKGRQLVAAKQSPGATRNILVCAHMDSKNNTPGALDNGAGTVMLLETMRLLQNSVPYANIEFVPFNSEEYFALTAEVTYLEDCKQHGFTPDLVINIDSPCCKGKKVAIATMNFAEAADEALDAVIARHPETVRDEPWYAGDHMPFAMQAIPTVIVSSSDLFGGALSKTHTPADTIDTVDLGQIGPGAAALIELIHG